MLVSTMADIPTKARLSEKERQNDIVIYTPPSTLFRAADRGIKEAMPIGPDQPINIWAAGLLICS